MFALLALDYNDNESCRHTHKKKLKNIHKILHQIINKTKFETNLKCSFGQPICTRSDPS